jgi:hypothetical protein
MNDSKSTRAAQGQATPGIVGLDAGEKLDILADILLEIIFEEGEDATTT